MAEFILRNPYEFGISHILNYYINTSVLLKIHPKKIQMNPHLGLRWRIFHILTNEDIDDSTDLMFDPLTVVIFVGV